LIVALFGLAFAPLALADDMDDILAFVERYGNLEEDLDAQSRLTGKRVKHSMAARPDS
jgi:hypothetical protein